MTHPDRWASDYPAEWPPLMIAAAHAASRSTLVPGDPMTLERLLRTPPDQSERQWHRDLVDVFDAWCIRVSTRTLRRWKRILEDHPTP